MTAVNGQRATGYVAAGLLLLFALLGALIDSVAPFWRQPTFPFSTPLDSGPEMSSIPHNGGTASVWIFVALGLLRLLRRGGIGRLHGQPLPLFGKL
jgi:hypothetical protein